MQSFSGSPSAGDVKAELVTTPSFTGAPSIGDVKTVFASLEDLEPVSWSTAAQVGEPVSIPLGPAVGGSGAGQRLIGGSDRVVHPAVCITAVAAEVELKAFRSEWMSEIAERGVHEVGHEPANMRARPVVVPAARHTNPRVVGGAGERMWRALRCPGNIMDRSGMSREHVLKPGRCTIELKGFGGADE